MTKADKLRMCVGCCENFYNGQNPYGVKECWSLRRAKVVTRYAIGTWTPMDRASNFREVRVLNCRHEKGVALCNGIPPHLQQQWRELKKAERVKGASR